MRSYDLTAFAEMLRDPVRRKAYQDALVETLPHSQRLLEIGGGTGYFACYAASRISSKVVSCDPNPLILLGKRVAEANRLSNVEFHSCGVEELPEVGPYDLILHDMRGNLPMMAGTFTALRHAREHLATPDCRWLPMRDTLWCALIEDNALDKLKEPWLSGLEGLQLDSTIQGVQFRTRYFASSKARHWGAWQICQFDYVAGRFGEVEQEIAFRARRNGTSHGFCIWFDSQLTESIKISSSPWLKGTDRANIYGVAGCLWTRPIPIQKGQSYRLQLHLSENGIIRSSLWQDSTLGRPILLAQFNEELANENFSEYCPPLPLGTHLRKLDITQKFAQNWTPPQVLRYLMEEFQLSHQAAHQEVFQCLGYLGVAIDYSLQSRLTQWHSLPLELKSPSSELLDKVQQALGLTAICSDPGSPVAISVDLCSYSHGRKYKLILPRGERLFEHWDDFLQAFQEELEWLQSESAPNLVKVRARKEGDKLFLTDHQESWLLLNLDGQVAAISSTPAWSPIEKIELGSLPNEASLQHRVAKLFSHCKFPAGVNPLRFCKQFLERIESRS